MEPDREPSEIVTLRIPRSMKAALDKRSQATDVPVVRMIRRAISDYLGRKQKPIKKED